MGNIKKIIDIIGFIAATLFLLFLYFTTIMLPLFFWKIIFNKPLKQIRYVQKETNTEAATTGW